MLKDNTQFKDINSLIEHLKKKVNIVGIVEYGTRACENMSIGGDYDLTVIFDKPISPNFSGVHFHIGEIPIDCMLLSVEDFTESFPANEFLLVHTNCRILYDRNDITKSLLSKIKKAWQQPKELSDFESSLFRFTFQHVLDKLEHRLYEKELYSRYFIYSSVDWFLQCYARIKNLELGKPRVHLSYIEKYEPELFAIMNKLYQETDLGEQFLLLKKCAEYMLQSIGGPWAEDEILFHMTPGGKYDEEEQKAVISQLFE